MKALIVAPYFYPRVGGVEKHAFYIAKGLKDRGHEVLVVTSNHKSKQYLEENVEGVRVIRLPIMFVLSNTPFNPRWYFYLRKIIAEERPDIIEAHTPLVGMADLAFLAKGKTKFAIKYHGGSQKKGGSVFDPFIVLYEKTFLKLMLRRCNAIMSVYPGFLRKLLGSSPQIDFAPPGVDVELFKPKKNTAKIADVTFVGRIERTSAWKGIGTLLKAIEIIARQNPEIQLRLVGDGDALDDFKRLAGQLGITKNVEFAGALKGKELVAAYNSARMLVLPSETDAESFGNVLIEAMACEIPVVGSRIGGIPNVIQDGKNGLLVSPRDPKKLAGAIQSLLDNPEKAREFGKYGRRYAIANFTRDALVGRTEISLKRALLPRIVHVTAHYPPHIGGMQKVVQELAQKQFDQGMNMSVITSNQGVDKGKQEMPDKFRVERLRSFEVAHTTIMPSLFFKLLRLKKEDVVAVHVASAYVPESVWVASKLRRFDYVAHVHLDVAETSLVGRLLLAPYKKHVLRRVLHGAKKTVVPTKGYEQIVVDKYDIDSENIVVSPYGTDYTIQAKPKNAIQKMAKTRLLFVGRLSAQKNVPLLLDAIATYSERYGNDVSLDIVGGGEQQEEIEKKVRSINKKNELIQLRGPLSGKQLENEFSEADIFVLTSAQESFGIVLIEAMSKGLPVVAPDIVGVRNVIQHRRNGLLAELNSSDLADALHKLVSDKKLYEQVSKNNLEDSKQYDWDTIAHNLSEVYSE